MEWSIICLVINDLKRKVCAYLAGFPGSVHDNRLWRNMRPYQKEDEYFSPTEYIICDTAFEPSPFCIPVFSTDIGFVQLAGKQLSNHTLSKPHASSEHTRKGQVPGALRKVNFLLTNETRSMKKITMYIDCATILNNMLIDLIDDDVTIIDDPRSIQKYWRNRDC